MLGNSEFQQNYAPIYRDNHFSRTIPAKTCWVPIQLLLLGGHPSLLVTKVLDCNLMTSVVGIDWNDWGHYSNIGYWHGDKGPTTDDTRCISYTVEDSLR